VGSFQGTIHFGGNVHSSHMGFDAYIVKFDALGTPVWSFSYGGTDRVTFSSVKFDRDGNALVAGQFKGTIACGSPFYCPSSHGDWDVLVRKFSPVGQPIFAKSFGDASSQEAFGVAADPDGNVLVVGQYSGTLDFGGASDKLVEVGGGDGFVAKLAPTGETLWARSVGMYEYDWLSGVASDPMGNVLVAGALGSSADLGGGPIENYGAPAGLVAKFAADGSYVWAHPLVTSPPNESYASTIATDQAGNVIASGAFWGSVKLGQDAFVSTGDYDILVEKLSPTGDHLTGRSFGNANWDNICSIAASPSGEFVLAGHGADTLDYGSGPVTAIGQMDGFIAKFAP
jgi:hypothetical protein